MGETTPRPSKNIKKILSITLAVFFLLICIAPIVIPTLRENARQISCASRLLSIGLALQQYATDFKEFFPDKHGAAGLQILQREGYCADSKIYICPSSGQTPSLPSQPLISSYEYQGGLKAIPAAPQKPLMWDKCGNHSKCCNVLFCDGHVETITVIKGKISKREIYQRGNFTLFNTENPSDPSPELIRIMEKMSR